MVDFLLASCARAVTHSEQIKQLIKQANGYTSWRSLPYRAEENGLAPLTFSHLQEAGVVLPDESWKVFIALTLRHQRSNDIRCEVLCEILSALHDEHIEALLLKGAALANSVYPRPGLRPMRDIDILVSEKDALRVQMLLADLGFHAELPETLDYYSKHHLPVAQKIREGLTVSVEIHRRLLPYGKHGVKLEKLIPNARALSINGQFTQTLGLEDMLEHIYHHSFAIPLIEKPIRYIWVADFVSLVEKHIDDIDWDLIRQNKPQIWHVMPLFHFLTPWSAKVIERLNLRLESPPEGIGQTFQGWPQSSIQMQFKKGIGQFLIDTFWPSEWWTSLYYGVDRLSSSWWWTRLVRHPLHIGGWLLQYLFERIT